MKIVFVGNCQAHALQFIYDRYIAPPRGDTTLFVDRWDAGALADNNRAIAEADAAVWQVFSGDRGLELELPPAATRLVRFPDVRGSFLWPYGNTPRPDNPTTPYKPAGPYDPEVGDRFLNRLIRDGVAPEEAVRRYRALDIVAETGLARLFELTLDMQRRRDADAGIETADFILEHLADRRLFATQGHLDLPLFNHLARQVFTAMEIDPALVEHALTTETHHPFEPFHDAPIHPAVIAHFGLRWLEPEPRFHHIQEGRFTFDQWVRRYMGNDWCPALHEAIALLDHPDHGRTLGLLDAALAQADGCGHGYEKKAHLLQSLGRFAEAADAMERALEREPGRAYYLGVLDHHRRRAAEA